MPLSHEPSATDVVVHRAVQICATIAYFSLSWEGEQVITFVRPFGKEGRGLWLRQVLHHPEEPARCACPACRWERYGDTRWIDHMIEVDARKARRADEEEERERAGR